MWFYRPAQKIQELHVEKTDMLYKTKVVPYVCFYIYNCIKNLLLGYLIKLFNMKWLDFAVYIYIYIYLKHVYHRLVKQVKSVNKQYLIALINMN